MKKIVLAVIMAAATFLFVSYQAADAGSHSKGDKAGHACATKAGVHRGGYIHSYLSMYKKHAKELGLSQEQQDKLAALDKQCDEACAGLGEKIGAIEAELAKLVKADTLDLNAVSAKIKEVHELRSKLELSHFESLAKAQQILTPEQRTQCTKLCETKDGKKRPMIH